MTDTLLRVTISSLDSSYLNYELIGKVKNMDDSIKDVKQRISLKLFEFSVALTNSKCYSDISQTRPRHYIPPEVRR